MAQIKEIHLKVRPLFSDFLEALFDLGEARSGSDRVHEQKCMGRCYGQSPHGGKLHVARSIENVHLRGNFQSKFQLSSRADLTHLERY